MSAAQQTWTIGSLLNWTAEHLAKKGAEFPRLDAEVLLAYVLECKRIDLYGLRFADIADDDVRARFRELVRKRIEGCPVAYLVGRKEFFGLELEVSPAVLIPRPDSEHVVMESLKLAKPMAEPRIVDIGTGSGNLAIAIAKKHPGAKITAIDQSAEALAVAQANAVKHKVDERIRFLRGDLFAPLAAEERFDLVISNPPYIASAEIAELAVGVRDYEPRAALDGGPDGFAVFDRLIAEAKNFLEIGGHLVVEIGDPQEELARSHLGAHAEYELAATVHDFSGHPRVVMARRV